MRPAQIHAYIIQHSFAPLMQGGRLDAYYEEDQNLFLDVQGLQVIDSEFFEQEGQIRERVRGRYLPLRLKFCGVSNLSCDDFFINLEDYPQEAPSRILVHFLSWRQPQRADVYYRIGLQGPQYGRLHFFARQVVCENKNQPRQKILIERDWSPAPPMPERLVPRPYHLYRQFGGDPITIKVNGRAHHRKLFIGELDIQPEQRPHVDAVLNLGEESSRWARELKPHSNDRSINKGEGSDGMSVDEILEEAEWVLKRLEQNKRILVHCVAGMNRSVTICCAVLMLLEGLSAQAALERVREHHPWARPDSHHWLALRWLELNKKE